MRKLRGGFHSLSFLQWKNIHTELDDRLKIIIPRCICVKIVFSICTMFWRNRLTTIRSLRRFMFHFYYLLPDASCIYILLCALTVLILVWYFAYFPICVLWNLTHHVFTDTIRTIIVHTCIERFAEKLITAENISIR